MKEELLKVQKKKRKKMSIYDKYRLVLISLAAIYIIFIAVMLSIVDNKDAFFVTAFIVGVVIVFISLIFGLIVIAGESDKNSIRILEMDFDRVDTGMKQLQDFMPGIFINYNYINTYVYNRHDKCYYQIYTKDDIKWMRNIGRINPREKYYYGS